MTRFDPKIILLKSCSLVLLLLLAVACRKSKDGCLDTNAANYDASADNPCCCQYPTLTLETYFKTDTTTAKGDSLLSFFYEKKYTTDGIQYFSFNKIKFYLSDFELIKDDGTVVRVADTLHIGGDPTKVIRKDVLLVTPDNQSFQSFSLGSLAENGLFKTLRFRVGLSGLAAAADTTEFKKGSALAAQPDTMWDATRGYYFNKISFQRDTLATTLPTKIIVAAPNTTQIEIQVDKNLKKGYNLTLKIGINFKKWLANIDFLTADEATITNNIVANTADAFFMLK